MTAPLAISQLSKSYGKHVALADVSLTLEPGEIFGLIGINGAGKTTLIKSMLDLVRPDAGTIRIFDRSHRTPSAREPLFYLPEKFNPSRYLTGREYLRVALRAYRVRVSSSAFDDALAAVDFPPEAIDRRIAGYSKGMAQKIGLIAALLARRKLYVFDEPMSGLDPHARLLVQSLFAKLKEDGATLLFTTHLLGGIDHLCDRIGIIADSRMGFVGTPAAFAEHTGTASLNDAFLAFTGKLPKAA